MDFALGEEERLLRETVRGLGQQTIGPHAGAWDEVRALPEALLGELGALGLLGLEVAEDEGGAGLGAVAASVLCEELAAVDGGLAQLVVAHNHLGLAHVSQGLQGPVRASELAALVGGERLVAWALPEHVWMPEHEGALGVTARPHKNGGNGPGADAWVLDGSVAHVLGAGVAGRLVIVADSDDGPTAWLCDPKAQGVTRESVRTLGARAAGTAHVRLEGVVVPSTHRLAEPGSARRDVAALRPRAHLGMAAVACGLARGALTTATAYAQEREQFGKPIARYQAIQWKLADMGTTLDAAWLLTMQAAWRCDTGRPYATAAARARLYAATVATRACSEALQIHGGYGYTREYPVERALRDARHGQGRHGIALRHVLAQAIAERFGH